MEVVYLFIHFVDVLKIQGLKIAFMTMSKEIVFTPFFHAN